MNAHEHCNTSSTSLMKVPFIFSDSIFPSLSKSDPTSGIDNNKKYAWVDVTYLDQEEYDQMVLAREAAQKAADNN